MPGNFLLKGRHDASGKRNRDREAFVWGFTFPWLALRPCCSSRCKLTFPLVFLFLSPQWSLGFPADSSEAGPEPCSSFSHNCYHVGSVIDGAEVLWKGRGHPTGLGLGLSLLVSLSGHFLPMSGSGKTVSLKGRPLLWRTECSGPISNAPSPTWNMIRFFSDLHQWETIGLL